MTLKMITLDNFFRLTVSGLLISASIFSRLKFAGTTCPDVDHIKPCTCNEEGLQCLKLDNAGLKRLFNDVPNERKAIRKVWILKTNLTSIEDEAFGEYILRDLYMDLNKIQTIHPNAFGKAKETLQTLSLSRNYLASIPIKFMQNMIRLKHLVLAHNKLKNIPIELFGTSFSVESLDLSNNMITYIDPNAFSGLERLTMLDLSKNSLKQLMRHSILVKSKERNLMVTLRFNQIHTLASDVFGCHHPLTLDLSRNQLTYLDEYVFAPLLMNNTLINVAENPFSCYGCEIYKWLLELDKMYLDNLDNFACMNGNDLRDLTLESIGCEVAPT